MADVEDLAHAKISVVVIDHQPIWCDGVTRELATYGFRVRGSAHDEEAAIRLARRLRPSVALIEPQLRYGSGLAAIRKIASFSGTRVLVLSASIRPQDIRATMAAGASGYLSKAVSARELAEAVLAIARGQMLFPEVSDSTEPTLTKRERTILRLVARGLTSPQIAQELVLSTRTVQNHVQAVLGKLDLHNRVELTRYAIRRGLDLTQD